jgi:hypothetical protein
MSESNLVASLPLAAAPFFGRRVSRGLRRLSARMHGESPLDFEILVPIWGERYIRRFAELGLRSLLAPGNLPWLADHHRVHVTILTAAESLPYFATQPAFRRLAALAECNFVAIDDLITAYMPNYSTVLTRAFNRAMAISPNMLRRNFIYLVGDLIFADGALRTVARAMAAGSEACLMCSPRADAATLEPVLGRLGTPEHLVLSNRRMVQLLLDHMHPTTVAKMVHGDGVHLSVAHQFFWRPEPDVIVSRCFLLHMLCIRPQRRPIDIAAPCDFSYVTELAPGGRYHYLTDCDSFVALEVQDPGHETQFVTTHPLPPAEIAERLSYWSTVQHRRFVTATFVFRGSEGGCSVADATALTQPYIDTLTAELPPPVDHRHHPFWLGSVGAEVLPKPRGDAALDGLDGVPPILHRLIVQHLTERQQEHASFGIAVTDRPGGIDLLLAQHAANAARIPVHRFYEVIEDVVDRQQCVLVVLAGELHDFLHLFEDRSRLRRLLRAIGPDSAALLAYAVDPDALRQGRPSRGHLRDLLAHALPLFARFGLAYRIHDLAENPLDRRHGCVIEIVPERPDASVRPRSPEDNPEEDALLGQRGGWAPGPPTTLTPPPSLGRRMLAFAQSLQRRRPAVS